MNSPQHSVQAIAAVTALNAAFKADPQAIWTLFNAYTVCNEDLANHPTVQVIEREVEGSTRLTVGFLGIINGLLESAIGSQICIMTSEPDENGQRKLVGFDVFQSSKTNLDGSESADTVEEQSRIILPA